MTWYAGDNSTNNGSFGWLFEAGSGAIALTGNDITTGQPTVGASSLSQGHVINANDLVAGSPVVQASTVVQGHVLAANNITTGLSVVETADIGQEHSISLVGITTGQPVVGSSGLVQQSALTAGNITTAPPTIGSADILHVLLAAANVSFSASVTADALRVQFFKSDISGILTTTASPVASYVAESQIICAATVAANFNRVQFTSASTSIHAILTASARLKWEPDTPQAEVWTLQDSAAEDWQDQSAQPSTWTPQAAQDETWTPTSATGATWTQAA
jgi:hypothetical protein